VGLAHNPYTESGEKVQIPDMLSDRADIYTLGEIIGESADAVEMSYLENALTSNPVLSRLASRSQQDVYAIIRMANNEPREDIDLEGNYSLEEISELVATMQKLMRVRDVILTVNREYIRSAAQSDDYRTEPAFKLQGSYRNMNRIAEKVVPIMNDEELTALIVSNYENDAQTLTSGAEANLLKFRELTGLLTAPQQERWDDIRRTFRQNLKMRGLDSDDRTGQVIATLSSLNDGLVAIQKAVTSGAQLSVEQSALNAQNAQSLQEAYSAQAHNALADSAQAEGASSDSAIEDITETIDARAKELSQALVTALTEEFSALRTSLTDINVSLQTGVEQMAADSQTTPADAAAAAARADHGDDESDGGGDEQTGEQTDEVAVVPSAGERQRITIVNKIPPTVVGVLKQQFKLMNAWMQPIHEATSENRKGMRKLQSRLDDCLELYRRLIERIENE